MPIKQMGLICPIQFNPNAKNVLIYLCNWSPSWKIYLYVMLNIFNVRKIKYDSESEARRVH